ncbi:exodeoxyribonuclease VII small subunit [Thermodesulfitimonas sp.]
MSQEKELSFEACLGRLEAIVQEIEAGNLDLDTAIARFTEGMELVRRCRALLTAAEQKICLFLADEGQENVAVPVESLAKERTNGLQGGLSRKGTPD